MSYAIRNDGKGWRAVNSVDDVMVGETFSAEPPGLVAAAVEELLVFAVQEHLDSTARSRRYDSILSACSYAAGSSERFSAEGKACVAWRDAVWTHCYQVLADVQAGTRSAPTAGELINELPAMVWPA